MKKTHFKLVLIFLLSAIAGCTTNDVNSPLVRFWNDGFIMTEKKTSELADCSIQANRIQARDELTEDERYKIYLQCRKNKGY